MGYFPQYKLNDIVNKTTKSVQQSLGRNFVQKQIEDLTSIVDSQKQSQLQKLLQQILDYQDSFIYDINVLSALDNSDINLSTIFSATNIDETSLNLTNLFDEKETLKYYAMQGLQDYLAFKDAAIEAFTTNLDLQEKIHTNTKFYDMMAVNQANGKTSLFMLDTKGLTDFMKNTNFVDFVPTGLKDKAGNITGTIQDYKLSLNTNTVKEDVLLKYFQSKVNQANSGVYQLDDTIAEQIFKNNQYTQYMTNEYSNNPKHNKGILMEPVLNKLLQGHSLQDTMNNEKSHLYQYSAQGFEQKILDSKGKVQINPVTGKAMTRLVDYKLNIASGAFGGAIGDAIGHAYFKEGNGQGKNLFSFVTEGRPSSTNGWDYKLVNTQIKTINFNQKTQQVSSVSWGSLSSIYQNTAIYADSSKFNNAINIYSQTLQNTTKKDIEKRVRTEAEYLSRNLQTVSDDIKTELRKQFKGKLEETFARWEIEEMLDSWFDEYFNSAEGENAMVDSISDEINENSSNEGEPEY